MEGIAIGLFITVALVFIGAFVFPLLFAFFYYHEWKDAKMEGVPLTIKQKWRIAKKSFFTVSLILLVFLLGLFLYTYFIL